MNRNHHPLFKLVFVILLATTGLYAQKESKTYKETFNVGQDAVVEINTTHTDIEFETWNKDQVEIVAVVELEGASDEAAAEYFESAPFEILGNSEEIAISTTGRRSWITGLSGISVDVKDVLSDVEPLFLDLEVQELPELAELAELPELLEMPPLPSIHFKEFDYDAYQKDGEAYLNEWTKDFKKGFDKDFKEEFEAWGKQYQEHSKERAERMAERAKERAEAMEERAERRAEEIQRRNEERQQLVKERMEEREALKKERIERRFGDAQTLFFSRDGDGPSIFYFSSDGESKKYKVKKTIKIKMPKSTRLKMNVKHGEVKLAATTKNINASLRYASLLAATIDGPKTNIRAAYSPVIVQKWSDGQLKTDYVEHVSLKEVGDLKLNAISSNIVIDRLNDRAIVTNDLGELVINRVSDNFSDIDVSVKNGEFRCKIPNASVSFYLNGTKSKIDYPSSLQMERIENFDNVIHKGFKSNKNSGRLITVNSRFSEVLLEK